MVSSASTAFPVRSGDSRAREGAGNVDAYSDLQNKSLPPAPPTSSSVELRTIIAYSFLHFQELSYSVITYTFSRVTVDELLMEEAQQTVQGSLFNP